MNATLHREVHTDLASLLTDLRRTAAHFIRCIKPNADKEPRAFVPKMVLDQLRCSGTVAAVELMGRGYPTRTDFVSLAARYQPLQAVVRGRLPEMMSRRGRLHTWK